MSLYNTVHFELSRSIDAAFWERVRAALAARRRELWFAKSDRAWRRVEGGLHPPVGLPVSCLLAERGRPGRNYVIANAYAHTTADDSAHLDWTRGIEIVPYSYVLDEPHRSILDARQGLFGLQRVGNSTGLLEGLQRAIGDALDGIVHDSRFGRLRWPDGEVTTGRHPPEPPFSGPWKLVEREDGSPAYRLRGSVAPGGRPPAAEPGG